MSRKPLEPGRAIIKAWALYRKKSRGVGFLKRPVFFPTEPRARMAAWDGEIVEPVLIVPMNGYVVTIEEKRK